MSGEGIHQVSLVSGLCTAGGAYTPTMCDEAIMVSSCWIAVQNHMLKCWIAVIIWAIVTLVGHGKTTKDCRYNSVTRPELVSKLDTLLTRINFRSIRSQTFTSGVPHSWRLPQEKLYPGKNLVSSDQSIEIVGWYICDQIGYDQFFSDLKCRLKYFSQVAWLASGRGVESCNLGKVF